VCSSDLRFKVQSQSRVRIVRQMLVAGGDVHAMVFPPSKSPFPKEGFRGIIERLFILVAKSFFRPPSP